MDFTNDCNPFCEAEDDIGMAITFDREEVVEVDQDDLFVSYNEGEELPTGSAINSIPMYSDSEGMVSFYPDLTPNTLDFLLESNDVLLGTGEDLLDGYADHPISYGYSTGGENFFNCGCGECRIEPYSSEDMDDLWEIIGHEIEPRNEDDLEVDNADPLLYVPEDVLEVEVTYSDDAENYSFDMVYIIDDGSVGEGGEILSDNEYNEEEFDCEML